MLFIEFSLAFNPIIHQQFIDKLDLLGFSTSLSNWIQSVQVPSKTSTTITLSTGALKGCVLSPLLFMLLIHNCTARSSSNIIKRGGGTAHRLVQ